MSRTNRTSRHPSERTLHRFADADLSGSPAERVASHVSVCPHCRARIRFIRVLGRAASDGVEIEPPAGILERALARRAAGERIRLPLNDPPRLRSASALARAAILIIAIVGGIFAVGVRELGAFRSDLSFQPSRPERGERIALTYRADPGMAEQQELRVRARLRSKHDENYNVGMKTTVVATLVRTDDLLFRGSFTLPDSIVYAVFAVETLDGRIVDNNGRRLWELSVHQADGRPIAEALEQRSSDMMGRNWELAFESAKELARQYPSDPHGLSAVSFFEPLALGTTAWSDSGLPRFQERFAQLNRELRDRQDLDGDALQWMMLAARGAKDSIASEHWRTALLRRFPHHTQSLQLHIVYDILVPHYKDTTRVLHELDSVWTVVEHEPDKGGPGYRHLVRQGLNFAAGTRDADLTIRWAERFLAVFPSLSTEVAARLAAIPTLRQRAIQILEAELDRVEAAPDEDRPLEMTVEENQRRLEIPIQRLSNQFGRVLLDDGQTERAAESLQRAVNIGWNTKVFRSVAEVQLELGQASAAFRTLARVAADPTTTASFADTARERLGQAFDPSSWEEHVRTARETMHRRTLRDATMRSLPERIRLVTRDGTTRTFREITNSRVTLVVIWNRYCGEAIQALPDIGRLAQVLEERGIAVVIVAEQPPSDDLYEFVRERGVTQPLYHDTRHEATRAFNSWGTPEYFITDELGRIRFEYTDLFSALRQAEALTEEIATTEGSQP